MWEKIKSFLSIVALILLGVLGIELSKRKPKEKNLEKEFKKRKRILDNSSIDELINDHEREIRSRD